MEMLKSIRKKVAILLEMIQFKLTVFAMPFAFTGAILAGHGMPSIQKVLWIVLAMVGARTSAMGFNRIVDRRFDGDNPRTADRAIPAGEVQLIEAWFLVLGAGMLFFLSCFMLNHLTLLLSPLALGLTFFYSITKRFTVLCHLILGIALAFSPLGGWVAIRGELTGFPYALSLAVVFWVAGFDTIYGCLDAEFDKGRGLYSLPSRLGKERAFRLAGVFHIAAFVLFVFAGIQAQLHYLYYIGLAVAAGALYNQHRLVQPEDLSKIHASFFSMNGIISVAIFCATWLSFLVL